MLIGCDDLRVQAVRRRLASILKKSLWRIHELGTQRMLSILLPIIFLLYPLGLLAVQPSQESRYLSPSELKKAIKVIIPEKEGFSSLKIDSSFFGGAGAVLNCRLFFRKPEEYALYMIDSYDSTPIFVVTHGDCILYDPQKNNIQYVRNAGVVYEVGMEKNQFILRGAFSVAMGHLIGEPKSLIKNTVVVDLLSIINQVTVDLKSKKTGRNEFLFMGYTERNGFCKAHINPTAAIPIISMMIYPKGDKNPIFSFNKIETEAIIHDGIFKSPLKRLRESKLHLKEMDIHEIKNTDLRQWVKAIFIRTAMRHPELRGEIEQMGFKNIDWPEIINRDERVSSILRKLFPIKEITD